MRISVTIDRDSESVAKLIRSNWPNRLNEWTYRAVLCPKTSKRLEETLNNGKKIIKCDQNRPPACIRHISHAWRAACTAAEAATHLWNLLTLNPHNYPKMKNSNSASEVKSDQFFMLYNICEFHTLSKNFFYFSIFWISQTPWSKTNVIFLFLVKFRCLTKKVCPKRWIFAKVMAINVRRHSSVGRL